MLRRMRDDVHRKVRASVLGVPHVVDEDGQTFIRGGVDTPDGYKKGDFIKMQMRMWKHLLCVKPMSNATFPTVAS